MAKEYSGAAPGIKTAFASPLVKLHGKGNWKGVEVTKGSGAGSENRGK